MIHIDDYKGYSLGMPDPIISRRTKVSRIIVQLDGREVKQSPFRSYSPQLKSKAIARAKAWIDKQPQTETAQ